MEYLVYWVISLLFVVALILGCALLIKRFLLPNSGRQPLFLKAKQRRLEVIETLTLDHKSRLLLIRRDQTEHLVLQGTTSDLVIERDIVPPFKNEQASFKNKENALTSPQDNQRGADDKDD